MLMSFYLVKYEDKIYANSDLYWTAIARGERAFMKMLDAGKVKGMAFMDQTLYPVTPQENELCKGYDPMFQDFDFAFQRINRLSCAEVDYLRQGESITYPEARLIELSETVISQVFRHWRVNFFKVQDYKSGNKYRMVPKMATVQVYGRLYVALNAVNVRVEAPIVITIKD
jgi:hypothetical protein